MPHRFVPWRRAVLWNQSRVEDAPNAAPDYESGGQEFESLRARHSEASQPQALLRSQTPRRVTWRWFSSNREGTLRPDRAGARWLSAIPPIRQDSARARDPRGTLDR